jgi:23S rRNA pseudouridine2605 synthase
MAYKELKRVLSKMGVASRMSSESIIRAGRVNVNGMIITDPNKAVSTSANIQVDGKRIGEKKMEIYAFNKPKGYITTMGDGDNRKKIADLMPKHQYLFPVGRLDKDSKGLILLTNDNDFGNQILSPESKVDKTYRVKVKGEFKESDKERILAGVTINNIEYSVKDIEIEKARNSYSWLKIVLDEGKNREIRRILRAFDYTVHELIRIQIGNLKLEDLNIQPGEYKLVEKKEILTSP